MPKREFVFVDDSNLWIEGQRVSAVKTGLARNMWEAQAKQTLDHSWRMDAWALREILVDWAKVPVPQAVLVGSETGRDLNWWNLAKRAGFRVEVVRRDPCRREKKVDVALASQVWSCVHQKMRPRLDGITLVTGDGDFVPLVQGVRKLGIQVKVAFWSHANRELKDAGDEFEDLDPYFSHVTHRGHGLAA